MSYTRVPMCSPYRLIWAYCKPVRDNADAIHRAYANFVWTQFSGKILLQLAVAFLLWPGAFLYHSYRVLSAKGAKVKALTGMGKFQQFWDMLVVSVVYSISPRKYYVFELFRKDRRKRVNDIVLRYELKGGLHNLLETRNARSTRKILNDKVAFALHCRTHGVAAASPLVLIDINGNVCEIDHTGTGLPPQDLFIKPIRGKGGRGCQRWDYRGGGRYRNSKGQEVSVDDLLTILRAHLEKERGWVIQPLLRVHPDLADLTDTALITSRMMSAKRPDGNFEVTNAVFKFSSIAGAVVDNFHQGGLVARVDIMSGRLGSASDAGLKNTSRWYDTHPTTGAPIKGRKLPLWGETIEMVELAHAAFPDRAMIGWDVAITDQGPVIIEGNSQSGLDMMQRTHDAPMGNSRLMEYYMHQVREALRKPPVPRTTRAKASQILADEVIARAIRLRGAADLLRG